MNEFSYGKLPVSGLTIVVLKLFNVMQLSLPAIAPLFLIKQHIANF